MNSDEFRPSSGTDDGSTDLELEKLRRVLDDRATWASPPPSVADDLFAQIRAEREEALRSTSWWRRRGWIRVAFGVAAALAIGLVASTFVASDPDRAEINLTGTELEPSAIGVAAIESTATGWSIRLELADLPAADPGYYYEGWVWNDQGEGVSIGTFHLRGGVEPIQLWAGVDVEAYPWIWITLQQEGAGAAVSDQVVMRGKRE